MIKKTSLLLLTCFVFTVIAPCTSFARPAKDGQNAAVLFEIVKKLLQKGDQAVVAIGRVIKAETYNKKLGRPDLAVKELDKLETEVDDQELLFAANVLKMMLIKDTEKDPQKLLDRIDTVIARAKKRSGQ